MPKRTKEESNRRRSQSLVRHHERRRRRLELFPSDLRAAERGVICESILADHQAGEMEAVAIAEALGLDDAALSPQRAALIRDLSKLFTATRLTYRLLLQSSNPELASRLTSLTRETRTTLIALGLERYERELDITKGIAVEFSSDPTDGGDQ